MITYIHQYYLAEKGTAMIGIILGILFLVIALLLWKLSPDNPLTKGLITGLLVSGLLQLVLTGSYTVVLSRKIAGLSQLQVQTDRVLQETEISRMKKVFASTYPMALAMDTVFIVMGLLLVFITSSPFWKGIGLSLMALGTVAHIGEAFSMQKNAAYQQKITALKFQ
ncbi:hypothetical protein ACDQ55_01175 [Chitinophaga sp. 30R24]|uniref:hypothetical protein n=1 Tax=Chitinophaga sp. 30R24 TaxID=3248838 RepID=UPI003B90F64E